ncbi:hypothetical protein E4U21_005810 [Claviceps maximensis]|nr:hypothetical protein E4U21_005810 [Claviceps maximensis]
MLPIQHSLLEQPGQACRQKPKILPCKYCSKRFRFVAELDLLVRHEKLVHLHDGNYNDKKPRRKASGATSHKASISDDHHEPGTEEIRVDPMSQHEPGQNHHQAHQHQKQQQQPSDHHTPILPSRGPSRAGHDPNAATPSSTACSLDVLSDAALAREVGAVPPLSNGVSQYDTCHQRRIQGFDKQIAEYSDKPRHERLQSVLSTDYVLQSPQLEYDDYNPFLDDFASSPHIILPPFEYEQKLSTWAGVPDQDHQCRNLQSRLSSRHISRLGSLDPETRDLNDTVPRNCEESSRPELLRISLTDHNIMKCRIEEFSSILPSDFIFPSRHTLTRFLEGYLRGFHQRVPILHVPTLSPTCMAPELLLAVLAVGAQYRFEGRRGCALWSAAKAVCLEQIRRRNCSEVHGLLPTAASYSPHSTWPSPSIAHTHPFAAAHAENTPVARLETMQAVLLLFAVGLWGVKPILQDALSLQSHLATLMREDSPRLETNPFFHTEWETWIRLEGASRTKLMAFCLFNLCSTAYDMPPLVLTSELRLYMPARSRLWRAESASEWHKVRQVTPNAVMTIREAFSRLFEVATEDEGLPHDFPSLGHYILIHALIQHVYLLDQTCLARGSPHNVRRRLRTEDVEEVSRALQAWQTSFETCQGFRPTEAEAPTMAASCKRGPLASDATALLRLAYIRLYTCVPTRSCALETRDCVVIASTVSGTALLPRSLRLHVAVFQAVHMLSVLVKAGVSYVARATSAKWSLQDSRKQARKMEARYAPRVSREQKGPLLLMR